MKSLWLLLFLLVSSVAYPATVKSANFIVTADTEELAQAGSDVAEHKRAELALYWFGQEFPKWNQPCPVLMRVGRDVNYSGVTYMQFENGEVFDWKMEVNGSRERVLDSVLPHEVNHTVMASYFRRPSVRWADEGACATTEYVSERTRLYDLLDNTIGTKDYIPLSVLIDKKQYPKVMPMMSVYAEGHSLVSFLLEQKPPAAFIKMLEDEPDQGWDGAIQANYGYGSVTELETRWREWVKAGNKPMNGVNAVVQTPKQKATMVAFCQFKGCPPCEKFKKEERAGKFSEYDVKVVYLEAGNVAWCDENRNDRMDMGELEEGRRLLSEFTAKTQHEMRVVPVFWVVGTVKYIVGFSEAVKLLQFVGDVVKKFAGIIFHGEPAIEIEPNVTSPVDAVPLSGGDAEPYVRPFVPIVTPLNEVKPIAEPTPEIDWGDVSVIVLVSKDAGTAKSSLVKLARGSLTRKLHEVSEGKAEVTIVSEQFDSAIYSKIVDISQADPSPVCALVLVGKQPLGIKALIAGKLERSFEHKHSDALTKANIELIFQRTESELYNDIRDALIADPPKPFDWSQVISALGGMAGGFALGWLKNRFANRAIKAVVSHVPQNTIVGQSIAKQLDRTLSHE